MIKYDQVSRVAVELIEKAVQSNVNESMPPFIAFCLNHLRHYFMDDV